MKLLVRGANTRDAGVLLRQNNRWIDAKDIHKYDVQWDVIGWDATRLKIILDREVKHEVEHRITHERTVADLGTKPLKLEGAE